MTEQDTAPDFEFSDVVNRVLESDGENEFSELIRHIATLRQNVEILKKIDDSMDLKKQIIGYIKNSEGYQKFEDWRAFHAQSPYYEFLGEIETVDQFIEYLENREVTDFRKFISPILLQEQKDCTKQLDVISDFLKQAAEKNS